MIDGLWRRGLLAAALSAVLIAVLAGLLARGERQAATAAAARAASPVEPLVLPSSLPRGEAWLLYVVAPGRELPARVAPVVALGADGSLRTVRAAPRPTGPTPEPWWAAGIVLPEPRLADLGPRARAVLLALMRAWRGALGLGTSWRAVALGIEDPDELEVLARWER